MDPYVLLAQEAGAAWWQGETVLLGRPIPYAPGVAVPAFLATLFAVAWIAERVVVRVVRRMSARTQTRVDDAFAEGLPTIFRPLFVLIALHVLIHAFLRSATDPLQLSPSGLLASKALTVLSILVIAFCVTSVGVRMIEAWVGAEERLRPIGPPLKLALKIGMVPLALLTALRALDVPIESFLAATAVGSLAVGLALQDTLKNMFAGIQIVLDQPIRAGDFIEVDRSVRGTVLEIGLRSTKLRNFDNNLVIIPNSTIAGAIVTNLDQMDRSYWHAFEVGVAYGSDTRRVEAALREEADAAVREVDGVAPDAPVVAFKELGESALVFSVSLKLRQFGGRLPTVTEVQHRLYGRLRREGIEIPFPSRTVYLRQEPVSGR